MKRIMIPIATLLMTACSHTATKEESVEKTSVAIETVTPDTTAAPLDAVTSATAMANHSSFNGTIVTPPQRYATVTLTIGGKVHETSLLSGAYVKKGDVLVTLENPDFINLQQTYLDASAQVEYMKMEYERQERLSSQEAASQKRFQQSKADYLSMKSRLEAAATQLSILGVLPADLQKNGIQPYLKVKSPLNGYVAAMNVNLGKYINAGESVCDVIDKGETLLCLTAYEKDLQNLEPGKQIQFRVNGMGEQTFHAVLLTVGQSIDETSRSLEVYARVKETNARFRPGMYVAAHIEK